MNSYIYVHGSADQAYRRIGELIQQGINPVMIHQSQPERQTSQNASVQNKLPEYAKQVINLGRKY